ncbi:MAG: hypothetical protein ACI841_003525 [Planctomycetota bacterium]|jgi:hypothetical protein
MLSLMVVTIVASMGAVLIQSHLSSARSKSVEMDTRRAFYIAEAGLSEGLVAIAQGKSGDIGTPDEPAGFANGVLWVEATETGNLVDLKATGLYGSGRSCLTITVQRIVNPVTSLGFFSRSDMLIGTGSLLDGYDSSIGTFASQIDAGLAGETTGKDAAVNANEDVIIEALPDPLAGSVPTYVYGDVSPGPGGSVMVDPDVTISGDTIPREEVATLPMIEVPTITTSESPTITRGFAISNTEVAYDSLDVPTGGVLTITGPATVIVGNLRVQSGGTLKFNTSSGGVNLHCLDNVILEEGSLLTQSEASTEPVAFMISTNLTRREEAKVAKEEVEAEREALKAEEEGIAAVGDEPKYAEADLNVEATVTIASSGTFYGLIYAPLANLSIPSGLRIYGSIVSDGLELQDGARVSFDEALTTKPIGASSLPRLISWRVLALPDEQLVRSGIDPILILRARGYTAPLAHSAHSEESLSIEYLDNVGGVHAYDGLLSDFDSTNVSNVLGLDWYDTDVGDVPEDPLPIANSTQTPDSTDTDAVALMEVSSTDDPIAVDPDNPEALYDTGAGVMTIKQMTTFYNTLSPSRQTILSSRMLTNYSLVFP